MYIIPKDLTRLQLKVYVGDAPLNNPQRFSVLHEASKRLANDFLYDIVQKFIKTEGDHNGEPGNILNLDVFVLSPQELSRVVTEARKSGEYDAEERRRLNSLYFKEDESKNN